MVILIGYPFDIINRHLKYSSYDLLHCNKNVKLLLQHENILLNTYPLSITKLTI